MRAGTDLWACLKRSLCVRLESFCEPFGHWRLVVKQGLTLPQNRLQISRLDKVCDKRGNCGQNGLPLQIKCDVQSLAMYRTVSANGRRCQTTPGR